MTEEKDKKVIDIKDAKKKGENKVLEIIEPTVAGKSGFGPPPKKK